MLVQLLECAVLEQVDFFTLQSMFGWSVYNRNAVTFLVFTRPNSGSAMHQISNFSSFDAPLKPALQLNRQAAASEMLTNFS